MKLKVNLIDILFLLLIAALVCGAALYPFPKSASAESGGNTARFTITLNEMEAGFTGRITEGKDYIGVPLYDSYKSAGIGRIVDIYAQQHRESAADAERGVYRLAAVDGLEHMCVVAEAAAAISDDAVRIGDYEIMVGKEVSVRSRDFAGLGIITKVEIR